MAEGRYALAAFFGDSPPNMLDYVPHCRELPVVPMQVGPGEATLRIPFAPTLIGDPSRGVVFGGVITTLLDQAGGLAVACSLEELRAIATIDLRVDYLRPATPGRDLFGYCHCYRVTRNVAFVRGAAYHDERGDPFATSVSTYMLGANLSLPEGLEEGILPDVD